MCLRVGPGSLIGLPAIVGNQPYSLTAAPCVGADIREISRSDFQELMQNPTLAIKALQILAAEVSLARRSFLELIS
jgi:CRP-like cAMP-binding protein